MCRSLCILAINAATDSGASTCALVDTNAFLLSLGVSSSCFTTVFLMASWCSEGPALASMTDEQYSRLHYSRLALHPQ